jgi:tetratricopeptide (TPR) repeat protein
LEHPGIVPVYALVQGADGKPCYAMRFVKGETLRDAIRGFHEADRPGRDPGERSLTLRQLLGRFVAVCNTLAYAHDRGIVHRDLKPDNIMLGKYGETLVLDWGLAKPMAGGKADPTAAQETPAYTFDGSDGGTQMGQAIGTPPYMSPEQAAGLWDEVIPASDVYSLGATLYCLLTGKAPLKGEKSDVLKKAQQGDFPPPRHIKPSIARPLEAICLKAMARKREDRYGSPRELAEDLEHWLAGEPVRVWPEPWTEKASRWMRRHKPLVSGAAAALLVGVIALTGGLFWYQDEQNRRATEETLRSAEADRKKALSKEAIGHALDQAEHARIELHAILKKPGGVFVLLNDPARWQAHLQLAQAGVDRAKAVLANADAPVQLDLKMRIQHLETGLSQDESDRQLALRLEKIRTDKASMVQGKLDTATAAREYPSAFMEARLPVLEGDCKTNAKRIGCSAIKEQLVTALDDWAWVDFTTGKQDLMERLLEVARLANPDPKLGDRLRQPKVWNNRKALTSLAKEIRPTNLSPQMLTLVGTLLTRYNLDQETWLRQAQAQYPADFWVNLQMGYVIRKTKPVEAEGFYRAALAVRPGSAAAYYNLGIALRDQKRPAEAIAAYQKAICLNPKYAKAYSNLGLILVDQKRPAEAIAAYKKAIDLEPKLAATHYNLGIALAEQKRHPEAIAAYQKAIVLNPKDANAYNNLGITLAEQKRHPEAIAYFQKAIDLDPEYAAPYFNLGKALREEKRPAEAIAAYQKAIDLDPKSPNTHGALGEALLRQGSFAEAAAATQKALDLLPADHPLRTVVQRLQKQCQQLLTLEKRLPLVLEKKERAGPDEFLALAHMCHQYKKRHASAVRLYQEAFQAQPRLADDLGKQHRYNAACAGALAGCGQGEEAAKLKDEEKSKLRRQARDWLQADLDSYTKILKAGNVRSVMPVIQRMAHWQQDADFAGVREFKELTKLPGEEKQAWQKLWTEVQRLHKDALSRFSETRLQGTLTTKETSKVHEIKMTAGKTYLVDMQSKAFDTFLKLEDAQGKLLAENDDISPTNSNSRILFTPRQDGLYRLIATSFQQQGQGQYEIIIREFAAKENRSSSKFVAAFARMRAKFAATRPAFWRMRLQILGNIAEELQTASGGTASGGGGNSGGLREIARSTAGIFDPGPRLHARRPTSFARRLNASAGPQAGNSTEF